MTSQLSAYTIRSKQQHCVVHVNTVLAQIQKFSLPHPFSRSHSAADNSTATEELVLNETAGDPAEELHGLQLRVSGELIDRERQRLTQTMDMPAWLPDSVVHVPVPRSASAATAASAADGVQPAVEVIAAPTVSPPLDRTAPDSNSIDTQNCTNENSENESSSSSSTSPPPLVAAAETAFTVKLKYLNDVIKVTSGKPSEPIGDFTR